MMGSGRKAGPFRERECKVDTTYGNPERLVQ